MRQSLLWLVALVASASALDADLSVRFDSRSGRFACWDDEYGKVLEAASVRVEAPGLRLRTTQPGLSFALKSEAEGRRLRVYCRAEGGGPPLELRFDMPAGERAVELRAYLGGREASAYIDGARAVLGREPAIALLKDQAARDGRVLTMTLGPADVPRARALFDRDRDLALTVESEADTARFVHRLGDPADEYRVTSSAPTGELLLRLALRPHYYRDELGIKHYAPLSKTSFWTTAPVVAMTWYASHDQTRDRLLPQIDWVAEYLLPYAGRHVFQLDDNYDIHDDAGLRGIADYIRARGLIPGIWFTPFAVAPPEVFEAHPDWFLHAPNGDPLQGFGGIIYGFLGSGRNHVLDVRNAEVAAAWFDPWWRKASETWGYDFFKIDGQPGIVNAYRRAAGEPGIEAYRAGLERGRAIVGPDKFINGCWGIPLEAIGRVNGSRTGGDTGNQPHAMDVVIRWNFLNNTAWWCDPDAAANLAKATAERVRLNTQARSLTGQQFLTDDIWTDVPDAVAHVWQRGMPSVDAKPVNLYPIPNWTDYTVFDLKIEKPWGRWDVVGVFNYGSGPQTVDLPLQALGIEPGSYHCYEFWSRQYLGERASDETIALRLAPYEGKLLAIHPVRDRPVVLSTSRHITQGGADLTRFRGQARGERATASGRSELLVEGEPYTITLAAAGSRRVVSARVDNGSIAWEASPGVSLLTIEPARSGTANWSATLARPAGPVLEAALEAQAGPEGRAGEVGILRLANPGTQPVSWRAESSEAWLSVEPSSGALSPGSSGEARLLRDGSALPYDTLVKAELALSTDPLALGTPLRLPVEFHTGTPPNLSLSATATASSVWSPEYEARMANDGSSMTRWNSRQGEDNGAWLKLAWPEPVRFDRVQVDETAQWGLRIREWVLEARADGEWRQVAAGSTMGPGRWVEVPLTEARELRLRIPRATVTPTINELGVYLFARE